MFDKKSKMKRMTFFPPQQNVLKFTPEEYQSLRRTHTVQNFIAKFQLYRKKWVCELVKQVKHDSPFSKIFLLAGH